MCLAEAAKEPCLAQISHFMSFIIFAILSSDLKKNKSTGWIILGVSAANL